MSEFYTVEPATSNLGKYIGEVLALARAVRADPLDNDHLVPLFGLSASASKAFVDMPDMGPFTAAGVADPETIEGCCDQVIDICERTQNESTGYAAGGFWLRLLAPVLARLAERLFDRLRD